MPSSEQGLRTPRRSAWREGDDTCALRGRLFTGRLRLRGIAFGRAQSPGSLARELSQVSEETQGAPNRKLGGIERRACLEQSVPRRTAQPSDDWNGSVGGQRDPEVILPSREWLCYFGLRRKGAEQLHSHPGTCRSCLIGVAFSSWTTSRTLGRL